MDSTQPEQSEEGQAQSRQQSTTEATDAALKELSNESHEMRSTDPWVRKVPMEVLIPHQLETMATSLKTPPYKLLLTGRQILEYIQEATRMPEITRAGVARMRALGPQQQRNIIGPTEVKDLMRIFSDIFKRIANTQFDPEDEANVKGFYGYVWSCHVESKNDFSETIVIHLLLDKYPECLEMSLVEAIKAWNPGSLVPLCVKNSHTFQILLKLLCQMFDYCNRHSRIMDFTQEFLKNVEGTLLETPFMRATYGQDFDDIRKQYWTYISMYPDVFHPILWFTANVKLHSDFDARVSLENSIIQDELLASVNELMSLHSEDKSLVLFFLASNVTLMQVINRTDQVGAITLNRYPYLWKQLHTQD